MKLPALIVSILLLAGAVTAAVIVTSASATNASIQGVVWNDVNGDGERQLGEPGMPGLPLQLVTPAGTKLTTTDSNGAYRFSGLSAGNYTVQFAAQASPYYLTYPIRQGAGRYEASVGLGEEATAKLDFGLHFSETALRLQGQAWINAQPIDQADIRTLIDGRDCTVPGTIIPPHSEPGRYSIGVAPESLIPGCGAPGKSISFTIDGQKANETWTWGNPSSSLTLSVGAPFAYYTPEFRDEEGREVAQTGLLEAFVDGTLCASIPARDPVTAPVVVPSNQAVAGCGYEGATVVFKHDGAIIGEAPWVAGRNTGPVFELTEAGIIAPPSTGEGSR